MRRYSMAQPQKYSGPKNNGNRTMHAVNKKSEEISLHAAEERSKILAQILWDSGCRKGDSICCVMSKSLDFLIALRGIQYANCKSVPINADRPVDYIQSVIFESGAGWIIADRSAEAVLGSDFPQDKMPNLGWMDSVEMIPASCVPEFVRDNIDHISLRSLINETDRTEPAIIFYRSYDSEECRKHAFSKRQIEHFAIPILEFAGIDSKSKVAAMMDCDSPSLLLETTSMFNMGARLCFFDFNPNHSSSIERLRSEILREQITHLFLESSALDRMARKSFLRDPGCSHVFTTVLWGEVSSLDVLARFKKTFPNSKIFKVIKDSERRLTVQVNEIFSHRFKPVASIPFKSGRISNLTKHEKYEVNTD